MKKFFVFALFVFLFAISIGVCNGTDTEITKRQAASSNGSSGSSSQVSSGSSSQGSSGSSSHSSSGSSKGSSNSQSKNSTPKPSSSKSKSKPSKGSSKASSSSKKSASNHSSIFVRAIEFLLDVAEEFLLGIINVFGSPVIQPVERGLEIIKDLRNLL